MYRPLLHGALTLSAIAVLAPGYLLGRLVESWPYEKLLREADLVVIARAAKNADSGERMTANIWRQEFLGVNTDFEVEATLKGKLDGEKLRVLHYRLPEDVKIINGPLLVSFRSNGFKVDTKRGKVYLGRPSYLLFLKKRSDGRYQAVSGQIDPRLSVREMYHLLPTELEEGRKKD